MLPTQPLFRPAAAIQFNVPTINSGHLVNVHERLSSPAGAHSVHLVQGLYQYYHYNQAITESP